MAEAKITISANDLAGDVFARVSDAMKAMNESVEKLGQSFVARAAEGVLLRDAIHEVIDVVKDGIMAFPDLVEHTIATGNSLYEMSLKTGASVENLSALRYVASQTGIDFESFGTTLFKMEQALGASGAKADEMQHHLDKLGLNLQDLKNEKPDQAFVDIMSALEEMPNRADQAAVGMAIFGRGFKEMAGLTQESITDLLDEAKHLGLVMSTETAAAAHAAEIGFKGFSMQLEAVGMEVAATVVPALIAITKLIGGEFHSAVEAAGRPVIDLKQTVEDVILKMLDWSTVGISTAQFLDNAFLGTKAMLFDVEAKVVGVAEAFVNMALSAAEVANKVPGMRGDFDGLVGTLKDSSTWIGGFKDGLKAESDGALDAAGKHAAFFDGLRGGIADMKANFHDSFTKAGAEIDHFAETSHNAYGGIGSDVEGGKEKVDKFANAWANLNSLGGSVEETVAHIDAALVEQISYYVTAGAKVSDLAAAYSDVLTPAQIDAIDKLVKGNEKFAQSWQKTQDDIERVWDNAYASAQENAERGLQLQLTKLNRQEQNEKDAAGKKIKDETQLQEMLDAIDAKYAALRGDATAKNAQKLTDEISKEWTDLYDKEGQDALTARDKQIAAVQKWYDDKVVKAIAAGVVDQTYYDNLYALADRKMADVIKLNDPLYKAHQKLQTDLSADWDKFLGDVYGGFSKTFSVDIVKALTGDGGFHSVWQDMWKMFKQDVESILSDLLNNVIQGFISGAEQKLGGFLAGLLGGNKSGDSSGDSGGGLLGGLLGFLGHGGGGAGKGGDENNPGVGGTVSPGDPGAYNSGGYFDTGGVVYAAAGWPPARGTDIVPAMLTPRERVLTVADNERFERQGGLAALRNGGGSALEDRIDALHQTIAQQGQQLQILLSRLPKMMVSAQQLSGA